MATSSEEMNLCGTCGESINPDQLPEHSTQCAYPQKSSSKIRKRHNSSETDDPDIPCEYCHENINLTEWESHSTKCANNHRRRIERLQTGTDKDDHESMTTYIPCEQCNKQILLKDWDRHSKQCGRTTNNLNDNIDEATLNIINSLIPCEYCNELVTILDFASHTEQCAETERQRIAAIAQRDQSNINLIPCQYCDEYFAFEAIENHQTECQRKLYENNSQAATFNGVSFAGAHAYPDTWDQSTPYNLSQFILSADSNEYKFVADQFKKTLADHAIVQIERVQNRRWYRQYDAHRDDFIERYSRSTEMWLFHGCRGLSAAEAIMKDCFNRSHAVRCAAGQGIYFASDARTSLGYTQVDGDGHRHMFMARVLVGQTTGGDQSTRICPDGYDTTGGGGVYVTYHDAQAYGEYLITFR